MSPKLLFLSLDTGIRRGLTRLSIVAYTLWIVMSSLYIATGPFTEFSEACRPGASDSLRNQTPESAIALASYGCEVDKFERVVPTAKEVHDSQFAGQYLSTEPYYYSAEGISYSKWISWSVIVFLTPLFVGGIAFGCIITYVWVRDGFKSR